MNPANNENRMENRAVITESFFEFQKTENLTTFNATNHTFYFGEENRFIVLPFILVFSSVFVLFAGLCIYFIFFCPSFIRELHFDTVNGLDEEGELLTLL